MTLKFIHKFYILIFASIISSGLFLTVSTTGESSATKLLTLSSAQEGVYVIDNMDLSYHYDRTKYEMVSLSAKPYAVIRGDKQLINILKFSGKPKFDVDLVGKPQGLYRSQVTWTGIDRRLQVDIYPSILDTRITEQQTIKFQPLVEVINEDMVDAKYVISSPKLLKDEVLVRDTQKKLSSIAQIKGVVDVSNLKRTSDILVDLRIYDRDGHLMDANLLTKAIKVRIPVRKKVVVVEKDVINKIVKVDKHKSSEGKVSSTVKKSPAGNYKKPTVTVKPSVGSTKTTPPKKLGILSFINKPDGLILDYHTQNLKWTSDIKVDLKEFTAGEYEMTVDDNGLKQVVRFTLTDKEEPQEDVVTDEAGTSKTEERGLSDGN